MGSSTLTKLSALVSVALSANATFADTFLEIASEPGDPLGLGIHGRFTSADGTMTATGDANSITIEFTGAEYCSLYFSAPLSADLIPGPYEGALFPGVRI